MSTLYVSDLDGTLLNSNQELEDVVAEQLNLLINNGINFTISTGRGNSAKSILSKVNFKLPIMILNGTLNYDFQERKYLNAEAIPKKKILEIIQILNNFTSKTFEIQTIIDNEVSRFDISKWNEKSDCLSLNILHSSEKSIELLKILSKIKGINFFYSQKGLFRRRIFL